MPRLDGSNPSRWDQQARSEFPVGAVGLLPLPEEGDAIAPTSTDKSSDLPIEPPAHAKTTYGPVRRRPGPFFCRALCLDFTGRPIWGLFKSCTPQIPGVPSTKTIERSCPKGRLMICLHHLYAKFRLKCVSLEGWAWSRCNEVCDFIGVSHFAGVLNVVQL